MRQNRVHVRLLIVAGVALLWTTGVFGRLSYLELIKHGEYLARAQRQQQRTIEITPKRGIIYDRNMRALAMSVPVKSAFAVPVEIADESLAARLRRRLAGSRTQDEDQVLAGLKGASAVSKDRRLLLPPPGTLRRPLPPIVFQSFRFLPNRFWKLARS